MRFWYCGPWLCKSGLWLGRDSRLTRTAGLEDMRGVISGLGDASVTLMPGTGASPLLADASDSLRRLNMVSVRGEGRGLEYRV